MVAGPDRNPRDSPAGDRPGGNRPPRRRRADALRNEKAILEAAIAVLAEQPGAGMAEIAAAGGLTRATLYRHFGSREELVRAIQEQAVDSGTRALAEADLERGEAPEALRRAIEALIGVGDRYRLLAGEPAIDPTMLQRQPEVARMLLAVINRGQDEGSLRADLPPAWILATLAGMLVLALREMATGEADADRMAERVASSLLGGISV